MGTSAGINVPGASIRSTIYSKAPYLQPQQGQHGSLKISFLVSKVSSSTLRLLDYASVTSSLSSEMCESVIYDCLAMIWTL